MAQYEIALLLKPDTKVQQEYTEARAQFTRLEAQRGKQEIEPEALGPPPPTKEMLPSNAGRTAPGSGNPGVVRERP